MAKDTFYFTHDYSTRADVKIKSLIVKHGYLGYGIFWAIIEDLYNNNNSLPLNVDAIAFDLRVDKEVVKSVINDFDLFVIKQNIFSSKSVSRRLKARNEKSTKAQKSAVVRWTAHANAMREEQERNAIKESKEKESKENKSKDKSFVEPSIEEVLAYFQERQTGAWRESDIVAQANKFHSRNVSQGWLVGKNKMKDWKAAVRTWIINNYDLVQTFKIPTAKTVNEKDQW